MVSSPDMERSLLRKLIVPIFLGLIVAGVLIFGLLDDGSDQPSQEAPDERGPASIWRCHACAKITGQNWQTCRTVTGRGSEDAARELVKQRVCEEASDPERQCSIHTINCRELSDEAGKARRSKRRDGDEP